MIADLSQDKFSEIVEAKRLGHNFMKIYLHRSRIGRNQKQIIISGAVVLRGYRSGMDEFGNDLFHFEEKRGESMIFEFDPADREYVCYLYDDPGKGYFSETGYNRDLLASHFEEDYFVIKEPQLHAEIQARYDWMKENPGKQLDSSNKIVTNINSGGSIEDIDSQIKFLQSRKSMMTKLKASEKIKEDDKKKAYKKLKSDQAKQKKIDEAAKKEIEDNKKKDTEKVGA